MRAASGIDADSGELTTWLVGSGIVLIQLSAVIPGLIPVVLLCLVLVIPVLVLGAVAALLVGIPLAFWKLAKRVVPGTRRQTPATPSTRATPEPTHA